MSGNGKLNSENFSTVLLTKGSCQNRKKKCDNYHILDLSVIIYNLFIFLSFWHHKEQLWSKSFFPLKKSKYFYN